MKSEHPINRPKDLWDLLRPYQWIKNGFVLIGIFFAKEWSNLDLFKDALLAFVAFCLMSSSVYIINDILDVQKDRMHPTKQYRPIAAGRVSPPFAEFVAAGLALTSLGIGLTVSWTVFTILLIYFLLNLVYSSHLKDIVIVDVFCIAIGFMLRILAGTIGIGIRPSQWILLCGLMLTLFLGFAKRRAEVIALSRSHKENRYVLQDYGAIFLDSVIAICAASVIITYSMYTMSPDTIRYHQTDNLIFTVPFVVYALFRYLYLIHHQKGGKDPSRELIRDPQILLAIGGWMALTLWVFTGGS